MSWLLEWTVLVANGMSGASLADSVRVAAISETGLDAILSGGGEAICEDEQKKTA